MCLQELELEEIDKLNKFKKYIEDHNLKELRNTVDYDVEADVYLLSKEEGGRSTPAAIGYRPAHLVKPDYLTTGLHVYLEQDYIFPGHTAITGIKFITPEVYPNCLEVGQPIKIQEGAIVVGYAKITKIINKVLEKTHNKPLNQISAKDVI